MAKIVVVDKPVVDGEVEFDIRRDDLTRRSAQKVHSVDLYKVIKSSIDAHGDESEPLNEQHRARIVLVDMQDDD